MSNKVTFCTITTCLILLLGNICAAQNKNITHPITSGYYADPTVVKYQGKYYIYATIDPWGGKELGVLETTDFKNFTTHHINWPTKEACTSANSNNSMVWAPSVRRAADGRFYMYVAVGSEVWVGVSNKLLGPWKNARADNSPLVSAKEYSKVHDIDADCFIDDDGQAYLYWGSGFNWVNGHCMAAKLNADMASFKTKPVDITPPHYFEAPHMVKRKGKYYLMYSYGKAIDTSYQIRYSVGTTPFGPWTEGPYDPILSTDTVKQTYGPGHHTVFSSNGQYYILYHRIHPQKKEYVLRELCLDSLNFDKQGNILKVHPSEHVVLK